MKRSAFSTSASSPQPKYSSNVIWPGRKDSAAVHIQVGIGEERIEIAAVYALRKAADIEIGIDVERHARHHVHLGLAQGRHGGAGLAVEVDDIEGIEVGDAEGAHPEPRQRQQMYAPHPAHAGDGDPLAAQALLLGLADPAQIAGESLLIRKYRHRIGLSDGAGRNGYASARSTPAGDQTGGNAGLVGAGEEKGIVRALALIPLHHAAELGYLLLHIVQ